MCLIFVALLNVAVPNPEPRIFISITLVVGIAAETLMKSMILYFAVVVKLKTFENDSI